MKTIVRQSSMASRMFFLLLWLLFFGFPLRAQLKIGGEASPAHVNAILELEANDKGLLFPRVSTGTRLGTLATAPAGLLVYDRDLNRLMVKQGPLGTDWVSLAAYQGAQNLVADTIKAKVGRFHSENSSIRFNSPLLDVRLGASQSKKSLLASFTKPMSDYEEIYLLLGQDTTQHGVTINYRMHVSQNHLRGLTLEMPPKGRVFSLTRYGDFWVSVPQNNDFGPPTSEIENRITHAGFVHLNSSPDNQVIGQKYGQSLRVGYGHRGLTPNTDFGFDNATAVARADYAQTLFYKEFLGNAYYDKNVVEHSISEYAKRPEVAGTDLNNPWYLKYTTDYQLTLGNGADSQEIRTMFLDASPKEEPNHGLVSIGHQSPDPSAVLDLNYQGPSNDLGRGLLLPRYSSSTLSNVNFYQPATGLLAFDQTQNRVVMNAGTPEARDWRPMVTGASNASQIYVGTVDLSAESEVTVSNPNVNANSLILLTCQSGDGGFVSVGSISAGSSFVINSSGSGNRTIGYLIIN